MGQGEYLIQQSELALLPPGRQTCCPPPHGQPCGSGRHNSWITTKKIQLQKKSGLESMSRHKIPPRGCFLASNIIIYVTRNNKIRVRSRYEVPGHGCQHRMVASRGCQSRGGRNSWNPLGFTGLHWFSLFCIDFAWFGDGSWHFSQNALRCWQACLGSSDRLLTWNFLFLVK